MDDLKDTTTLTTPEGLAAAAQAPPAAAAPPAGEGVQAPAAETTGTAEGNGIEDGGEEGFIAKLKKVLFPTADGEEAAAPAEQPAAREPEKPEKVPDPAIAEMQAKLEAMEAERQRERLQGLAEKQLEEAGLDKGLAAVLSYDSPEALAKSFETVSGAVKAAVTATVQQRLAGSTPTGLGTPPDKLEAYRQSIRQDMK